MINKIIRLSLHNRVVVIIVSALMLLVGGVVASRMEVDVFPDLTAPTVVVMTEAPGMATTEVERLVTFPIEAALNGATNVRRVRSNTATGFSVVTIEFDWGADLYQSRQIVAEKLSSISEQLPVGVARPVLAPESSLLGEVMVVGLTADSTSMEELRTLADWTLRPRLLSTTGVAQVTVVGGDIKEYQIVASPAKMLQMGVSLDEIITATEELNTNAAGSVVDEWGSEYIVRGMIRTTDTRQLEKALIKLSSDGQPIILADVAQVVVAPKTPKMGDASINMQSAVRLSITKQPKAGTIDLTTRLDQTLADIQKGLPADVNMTTEVFRQEGFINASINNIQKALIEGGVLVVIVLMIFLGNFRTTIISLLAIPLSLLFSMVVLHLLGLSLNTMSLGGMAIAIGSLVDDAIIDVENVFKRLRQNQQLPENQRANAIKVVYDASVEIRSSIWGATLIIMVTFMPLFFLSGMEGRMLIPLGIAFIVSLFASMIVAITLTPVLSSYLLTSPKMLSKAEGDVWMTRKLKAGYRVVLGGILRYRKTVVISCAVLFVGAMALMTTLGRSFLPPFNEGSMAISVSALPGISLDESRRIATLVEKELLEIPEVKLVSRKTGRAELDEHALGTSTSEIDVPFELKDRSREELFADVRQRLAGIKGLVSEIGQPISHRIDLLLSGSRSNVAIKLYGPDLKTLFDLGNAIKANTSAIEGFVDVNVEQQIERPEMHITPSMELLARRGITLPEFREAVEVSLAGRTVSQVYDGTANFDITLKYDSLSRSSAQNIADILIDCADGSKVPLSEVAQITSSMGANSVNRENVSRKIVVSGNIAGGDLGGVVEQIRQNIEQNVQLPQGYHIEYGGQVESQQRASMTLMLTSIVAIIIVFLLLLREFKQIKLTSIVMVNLPLSLIGGVVAIWLTSGVMSIPSIIGFISLFGIATRNGILLVSHFEQLAAQGIPLRERVIEGSLDRISPIVMTALTSGLALIPLALGGSLPGNEIQSPMAIVILGGLLTSTLLNLLVVPTAYYMLRKKDDEK